MKNRRIVVWNYTLQKLVKEKDPAFVQRVIDAWRVSGFLAWNYWDDWFSKARKDALMLCHPDLLDSSVNSAVAEILIKAIKNKVEDPEATKKEQEIKDKAESNTKAQELYGEFKASTSKSQEEFLRTMRLLSDIYETYPDFMDMRKSILSMRIVQIKKEYNNWELTLTKSKEYLELMQEVYDYDIEHHLQEMIETLVICILEEVRRVPAWMQRQAQKRWTIAEIRDIEREYNKYNIDLSKYVTKVEEM